VSLRPLLAFAAALGVGACVTSTAEPTSTAADQATLTQFGGLPQAPPLFLGHDEGTDSPGLLLAPNWPSLARETGARASAETALLTTELVPDRAGAILAPRREFGESRIACNAFWLNDFDAGRINTGATIARLHAEPEFAAALNSAETKVAAAVRADSAQSDAAICAAEAASLHAAPAALR
jgi:hypothetical protein